MTETPRTLTIETRSAADLRLDPNNVRRHGERNLDAIAASLSAFGQRKPLVIVEDGTIIVGNGTFVAATERLGWTEFAVSVFPGTPDEARAYAVADNRSGELASWDVDELIETLGVIDATGLLAASGFRAVDLDDLRASVEERPSGSGMRQTPSLDEYADSYASRATRLLMMEFPAELYGWITDRMIELRKDTGAEDNGSVLVSLIESATGLTAPVKMEDPK